MPNIKRLMMLHRLHSPETGGEGGSGGGSTNTNTGGEGGTGEEGGEGEGKGTPPTPKEGEGESSKSRVTDAEAKLLKEVMQRKNEAKQAAAELEEIKKRYEGIDPNEVRQILQERQQQKQAELEAKGEWDKLKEQMAEAHKTEKATLQTTLSEKDADLAAAQKTIADLTVGQAFSQSGFIREEVTLPVGKARGLYGAHFEFSDGKLVGYDKPAHDASRSALVDASGEPLVFEEAIKAIITTDPDAAQLLRSKMKAGAGSKTTPAARTPDPKTDLRGSAAIAAGLKNLV